MRLRSLYVISALLVTSRLCAHAVPFTGELTAAAGTASEESRSIVSKDHDASKLSHRLILPRAGQSAPIPIPNTVPDISAQGLRENDLSNTPEDVRNLNSSTPPDTGEKSDEDAFFADLLDDFYKEIQPSENESDPTFVSRQEYLAEDGDQRPLKEIPQNVRNALWVNAGTTGRIIRKIIDKYVASGKSRVDTMSQKPQDITQVYDVDLVDEIDIDWQYGQVDDRFNEAGVPITKNGLNERWTVADVRSKGFGNARIVSNTLELGIQVEGRAIVSLSAFANRDLNIRTKRLRSSELTWQTWAMTARRDAYEFNMSTEAATRSLKYVLRHNIINQETQNIIDIAHHIGKNLQNADGTPCVSKVPADKDGNPLDPITGQGLWKPDTPIYDFLLSTPNIKPIAHMIADHCSEMDNPYIAEIHTFPSTRQFYMESPGSPLEASRSSAIVLVLGPRPASLSPATDGVVATS